MKKPLIIWFSFLQHHRILTKQRRNSGKIQMLCCYFIKIENGNGEYVKETTTCSKSIQQPKDTDGSSTQRENVAP